MFSFYLNARPFFERFRFFYFLIILIVASLNVRAQTVTVSTSDTVSASVTADFYGIQYHANTFTDAQALNRLALLHLVPVRIWAKLNDFHPQPNVWQWADLDQKVDEVIAAGYQPMVCLYQSEQWFTGSADNPWWNDSTAISEWQNAAYQLALRYHDRVHRYIIFDEINMMHPEDGYYISFARSAQLYCQAAKEIKRADPALLCGGPSSFGGWENGYWAKYVLNQPDGNELLDFISANLFLSWNADDPDSLIMNRTIWYEEAAQKIESMVGTQTSARLVLDAYNVSALWQKNGQLWTDPRNTNFFASIYQVAALLHALKGGFSVTLHWETIGGYGVLDWYPQFNPLPPYYAWRFLIEVIGLSQGSKLIQCHTDETPKSGIQHHGGMQVNAYEVQPFALQPNDTTVNVVLIRKYRGAERLVKVIPPEHLPFYRLFRLDSTHVQTCFTPFARGRADSLLLVRCPQRSVTVIQFSARQVVGLGFQKARFQIPSNLTVTRAFPNPFNASVRIEFKLGRAEYVTGELFDAAGQKITTLFRKKLSKGGHYFIWKGKNAQGCAVASGVYYVCLYTGNTMAARKIIYLK